MAVAAAGGFNLSLEVWERFLEPVTLRVWFWNPKTEEARSVGLGTRFRMFQGEELSDFGDVQ